jgi:ABC-type transport system involved in multi-copper enzyme maturation permease subunit
MTNNIKNIQIDFIQKRFNISALLSGLVLIGLGVFLFIYSKSMDGNMLSSALIFFGIVSIIFAMFLLIARLNSEVYAKTNSPIIKRQIYFDTADFYDIKSAIENDKLDTLDKFNKVDEGNVQLYVVHSKDKKFAALQLLKYEPFDFIPQTDVMVREF